MCGSDADRERFYVSESTTPEQIQAIWGAHLRQPVHFCARGAAPEDYTVPPDRRQSQKATARISPVMRTSGCATAPRGLRRQSFSGHRAPPWQRYSHSTSDRQNRFLFRHRLFVSRYGGRLVGFRFFGRAVHSSGAPYSGGRCLETCSFQRRPIPDSGLGDRAHESAAAHQASAVRAIDIPARSCAPADRAPSASFDTDRYEDTREQQP